MTAAWPVLSGAADARQGPAALEHGLGALEKPDRILLLTPPFDENSEPYPGRIADYPPGVRENGGQYSHGASWTVDAFVALADRGASARRRGRRAATPWRAPSRAGARSRRSARPRARCSPSMASRRTSSPPTSTTAQSYGGRGGWSWYTGSAARMLSAAYAILGFSMEDGHIHVPDDLHAPRGDLRIKRLWVKGELREAAEEVEEAV